MAKIAIAPKSAFDPAKAGVDVGETILILRQITKLFGKHKAVDDLSLEINKGEIFTLLGPSGCGKTTTLRQIAGLEQPDAGEIHFHETVLFSSVTKQYVPTHKRRMGMVFQSYAIWPHLTVYETVAYPLRARRFAESEIHSRVMSVLELVGLQGMEERPGPALSGGQQQRVALARSLVYEPEILLLDEPFSNLDAKLREQMRVELKLLQRRIGVAVILVTHDQLEALSLSDRIAVMHQGRIEQIGTPQQLYEKPATPFVRDFIGTSVILPAKIARLNAGGEVDVMMPGDSGQVITSKNNFVSNATVGRNVSLVIRPEDIVVDPAGGGDGRNQLNGTIKALLFIGDRYECHVQVGGFGISVYAPRTGHWEEGQQVRLYLPEETVSVWPN